MGGFGSGRWKKPGRKTVDSCPALDVGYLAARGWLQPGRSGSCPLALGNGPNREIVLLDLRAEAEYLCLSWRLVNTGGASGEQARKRESATTGIIIPIARVPWRFGGTRPYFVCSGEGAGENVAGGDVAGESDAGGDVGGETDAGGDVSGDSTGESAGESAADEDTAGKSTAGCRRQVTKLYFSYGRLLCRHCSKLVYPSRLEQQPWLRAQRRANKLWRRLGAVAGNIRPAAVRREVPAPDYEYLLDEVLEAEIQATEAGTARILQIVAQIDRRYRKPQFTL
jgi:hypothetical protein